MFVCGCFPHEVCSSPWPIYASVLLYGIQRLQSVICSEVFGRSRYNPLGVRALHIETSLQDQIHSEFPSLHFVCLEFPTNQVMEPRKIKELKTRPANKQVPHPNAMAWRQLADCLRPYLKICAKLRKWQNHIQRASIPKQSSLESNKCLKSDKYKKIQSSSVRNPTKWKGAIDCMSRGYFATAT